MSKSSKRKLIINDDELSIDIIIQFHNRNGADR